MLTAHEANEITMINRSQKIKKIQNAITNWEPTAEAGIRAAIANGQTETTFIVKLGVTKYFEDFTRDIDGDMIEETLIAYFEKLGYEIKIVWDVFFGSIDIVLKWGKVV